MTSDNKDLAYRWGSSATADTPYVDPEISILDQHIQRWKDAADQLEAELTPDELTPPPTIPDLKTVKAKAKHHAASQPRPNQPAQLPVSPIQQTIVMGLLADLERTARANIQIRKVTLLLAVNWAAALIALLLEITVGK